MVNANLSIRLIAISLFVSLSTTSCSRPPQAEGGGPQAVPVQIQDVTARPVEESSEFVGALEAQERVELRPERDGRVVQVLVTPGQPVEQGTPIAELRADRSLAEASGARAGVSSAQADVQVSQADTIAAQASLTEAEANLRARQSARERAVADVTLQESEFSRISALVNEGALAEQQLDRVRNSRDTAIAERNSAEQEVAAAQAAVENARAQLARTQAAQTRATAEQSRAQAESAAVNSDLQENLVRAPIAGIISNVPVKVGDFVTSSDPITSIIQNGSLELNLSVPIERAPDLRTGLPVELLDQQGNPLITGRISFIAPQVNSSNQVVLAKAAFNNNGQLKDGQFVRARVIWRRSSGVLVPTTAISRLAGQTFVFVAEPGEPGLDGQPQQIARQRLVKLGEIQGDSYQVLEGVSTGEQIITSGILNLQDNTPIAVVPPGGPPSPGASPSP